MLNVKVKDRYSKPLTSNLEPFFTHVSRLTIHDFHRDPTYEEVNPACDEKAEIRPGYYAFPFQE